MTAQTADPWDADPWGADCGEVVYCGSARRPGPKPRWADAPLPPEPPPHISWLLALYGTAVPESELPDVRRAWEMARRNWEQIHGQEWDREPPGWPLA